MDSNQDFGSILNSFSGSSPTGPKQDSGDGFGSLLTSYEQARTQPTRNVTDETVGGGNVDEFVKAVSPAAQRVAQRLNVPVEAIIGQWGVETGWGKSVIPGTNNLGNIKSTNGKGVAATDNQTGSRDAYRQYGSVDEFADDFANLVGNGRYKAVSGSRNPQSYFQNLQAGGYAEAKDYVQVGTKASAMAAEALKRAGVAPAQQSAPDLSKAPKWADVEGKAEFKALSPDKQAAAKAAYFDYWIAPRAGERGAELRQKFLTSTPAAPTERTWGEAASDTAVQLAEGVNTIFGAVPNLVAPESGAAEFFNKNAEFWREKQSQSLRDRVATADKAISKAGEDGVVAQITEAASQYFSDPAMAARFVTTNLPSMIPGIGAAKVAQAAAIAKGASAAKAASVATTAAGGVNAVLNAGGARGEAFEDIKRTLIEQGMSPQEAEQRAIEDSRVVAAVGGVAGFVSGKVGLEKALVGGAGKGGARAAAGAFTKELAGEQIEEVAPKLTTNVQAGQYDNRNIGQDVGRTIVETAIGSGPGAVVAGGASAFDRGAPEQVSTTPDGRIEPTVGGDQTVTPAEPAGAPAINPMVETADSIVRELAQEAGIPESTVLPTPAPQQTTGPESVSDQDVQEFAANRYQQLREKRDGSIQSVVGESGIVDQDTPGVGLTPAEQTELDTLQRANNDPTALRQLYGFDQTIPSDQSQLANEAQVPAPTAGPVEQPMAGDLFPATTEPGLVAAQQQENPNAETQEQAQGTGPALNQDSIGAVGQPSGPAPVEEPAAQAAVAQDDGVAGQQLEGVPAEDSVTPRPQGQFANADEAKKHISAQRRASSARLPRALPLPYPDGTFGYATEGGEGWADAVAYDKANAPKTEKQAKERRQQTQQADRPEVVEQRGTLNRVLPKKVGEWVLAGVTPYSGNWTVKYNKTNASGMVLTTNAPIEAEMLVGKSDEEIRALVNERLAKNGLKQKETDNGTQATQAQQAKAQGQETPVAAEPVTDKRAFKPVDTFEVQTDNGPVQVEVSFPYPPDMFKQTYQKDGAIMNFKLSGPGVVEGMRSIVTGAPIEGATDPDTIRQAITEYLEQQAKMHKPAPETEKEAKAKREKKNVKNDETPAQRTESSQATSDQAPAAAAGDEAETSGVSPAGTQPAVEADGVEDAGQDENGPRWNRMTTVEREAVASQAGLKQPAASNAAKRGWQGLDPVVRDQMAKVMNGEIKPKTEKEAKARKTVAKKQQSQAERETITPANDKSIGQNADGEPLYERKDGSRYRMHYGKPDFGGDLSPVEQAQDVSKTEPQNDTSEKRVDGSDEPQSAAEWANEMTRLRSVKPRPLEKLYGKNPTEKQVAEHKEATRKWDAQYRKASKMQKQTMEAENAAFRQKQDDSSLQSAMESAGWAGEVAGADNTIWTKRVGQDRYTAMFTPADGNMEVTVLVDTVDTQIASFKVADAKVAATSANKAVADDVAASRPVPEKPKTEKAAKAQREKKAAPKVEKTATPAAESSTNTEDAGAELTYNKRNRIKTGIQWSDIADKDAALRVKETTKQNVYPRPDYQALVDGGMQPMVAHIVKQAYDSIATAPQIGSKAPTDEQLKSYIDGVRRYMDGVMTWANNPDHVKAWVGKVAARAGTYAAAYGGKPTSLTELAGSANDAKSLLDIVYPNGWKESRTELILIGGNKALSGLQPGLDEARKATKDIDKGWPSKQEAWQKQGYRIVDGSKLEPDFYESNRSGTPRVYAMLKFNDGRRNITIVERNFDGIASKDDQQVQDWMKMEQEAYKPRFVVLDKNNRVKAWGMSQAEAEQQARDLTKRTGGGGSVKDEGISVEMAERTGVDHRMPGEDISSERLMETFGFRGVNFGNWMKGESNKTERQLHLNHIYDSFMDLANILGVPPKAMSLDGLLGVAVGAQGNGKASAHFVPGVNEINLTRTAGAGALAHEWGHALDHYFARQADLTREQVPYLTEHAQYGATMKRTEMVDGRYQTVEKPRFAETIRPELVDAFKAIVQTMTKRAITEEEVTKRREESLARATKNTESWIKAVRRDFESAKASDAVLAKFDALAERVRKLDLGDGKVSVSSKMAISQPVAEMRDLYKQATGRTYSLDQTKGLQANVDHLKYLTEDKQDAKTHEPQQVSTTYKNEAAKLDGDKGGKPYWSTTIEMFARAFDAYVFDKVAENQGTNTYLAGLNNSIETSPMGDERKAINAAFDKLVATVEHEETESGGVRLFDFTRSPSISFNATPEPMRVNALQKLEKLDKKAEAGKITDAELRLGMQQVIAAMRNQKEERDYRKAIGGRRRGYDWVVAQLHRYVADEGIDREVASFANWLLDQNPNLANDLGIGITSKDNVAGDYNAGSRVFRLVAGKANTGTGVHEILHHSERMMPAEVQDGILREWQRAWFSAFKAGDKKMQQALLDMMKASLGSKAAYDRVQAAFNDGTLTYDQHYQLYSPSEYWAVNATRILSGRYAAKGSWVKRAVQWFKEFIERVKGVFGLKSDAPILKALKAVMNGDGQFQQDAKMLVERGDDSVGVKFNDGERTFNDFSNTAKNNAIQFFGNRNGESLKTFGLYDKTLSTQYNKALKDKHFGKVFGYVNAMQNEVSLTSIRPAELAPGVLPRVDDVKSAFKQLVKGKKADKNLEQAANAVFEGTLAGDSVTQGKVWSDDELRSRGLNDTGIALYKQARAAIDASLDEVAAAEAYAMAQGFVPKAMRRQIIDNPQAAAQLIGDQIKKQIKLLDLAIERAKKLGAEEQQADLEAGRESYLRTQGNIDKIFVTAKNLKQAGYAPLMRFGKFTVTVQAIDPKTGNALRDENGESITEFFGQYETEGEAKSVRAQMEAKYKGRDDMRVSAGTKSQTSHELYSGISPETLALFAEAIGADAAMRKHIELAMSERSALKRRLHRKGTEGYSQDLPRVMSQFITSNGRHAAQRYYLRDLNNAIKYIPKEKGDVLDEAIRLKKFVLNPNDPAAPVSSIMFAWFLGGSVASAVVNLSQPVMMTGPYLSQFGAATAAKAMATAMPYAMGRKEITDASLRDALKRASQEGIVDAQEIFHLYSVGAQGVASGLVNQLAKVPGVGGKIKAGSEDARARINAFLTLWGSMFAVAEGFNRKLTFLAAWDVAKANGEKNPYAFAVRAVNETQGIYNKVNRPNWAQGPVGRTLLTFKQFSIMYVELLSRMWKRGGPEGKRAALVMLAVLMLAAGEEGLPFAQDLDDLIDTVGQMFGLDTNMKRNKRRLAHELLGKGLGDMFLYGVSPYLPLDFSGRLGLGNLIPGTALLKPSDEQQRGRQVAEIFGPTAGMATQIGDAYDAVVEGNTGKAVQNLAPKAVKDALASGEMAKKGYATDAKGRKVVDVGLGDAAIKGIGFQPTVVANETRKTLPVYQDIALQKRTESSIVNQWVRALADNDTEMAKEAQQRMTDWNRRNPATPIQITPDQIRNLSRQMVTDKDTRLLKSAPKEMRGRVGLDLAK